ncbi:C-type mannose receptor 2-like isoform X2 [Alosa pseudoharengus]|uniref:C-type mannose receptor 2-like isoform X2 n=1 Tax=Alosa pseudoharengus TaxID=34774 RepID=UPI003F8B5775
MLIRGLFSCRCLAGQYHFVSDLLNWTEAQKYCRANYTDLATITSLEDHTRFTKYVEDLGYSLSIWIGLYYDIKWSWSWSLDGSGLRQTGYSGWSSGEPDQPSYEHCTFMYTGLWGDRSCSDMLPFLCYDANEIAANQYILITQPKSWNNAQNYCREHHTDLASSRNQEENQRLAIKSDSKNVWIGLFRDTWQWSDNSKSRFTAWGPKYPKEGGFNDKCAAWYASNHGWADDLCEEKKAFMCQTPPSRVVKVTIRTDSPLKLEDPAVQAAIAEQIQQKLHGQRVTWRQQPDGKVFHEKKNKDAKRLEKRDEL